MRRALPALAALYVAASCVPADEALPLGSVQFRLGVSRDTAEGAYVSGALGGWTLRFDRVLLGFKTMTLAGLDDPDACSYRGRGASSDVLFDPRRGLVQTFNGIRPTECPDVGVIFGPPGDVTTLGEGVTSADLVELARGRPAHAIVEATAQGEDVASARDAVTIKLRFASDATATRFGGCRSAYEGVRVVAEQREDVAVRFAAEDLFREAISRSAALNLQPFVQADFAWGDDDGVVTMDELDAMPLSTAPGVGYQLPDGTRRGTFGDYVRALFRFTLTFRDDGGYCVGSEPQPGEDAARYSE